MNSRNLPSCVPFILLVCLSTTDHTTQEDKATAGSTCRREAHLMPSYPDPAPRSPWRAHAAKRRRALATVCGKRFPPWFSSRVCPRVGRGGGRLYQNFADPARRQNPVLPCKSMYGGANAILERTGNSPPTPQSKSGPNIYIYLYRIESPPHHQS